ncbi:MAG: Ig-like domain-containing protein [Myxococcales bacterium]|nr:Ig-like domain-containing protein [Myxococcales bacterium]
MVFRDRASLLHHPIQLSRLSRSLAWIVALAFALIAGGCGDDGDDPPRMAVNPTRLELVKGRTGTATATADGRPAGRLASWSSANLAVATVSEATDGSAVITGVGVGETEVTVSMRGGSARLTVVVADAVIESIAVTPPTPSLAAGTTTALTATAMLSDMTTRNVTAQVTWTSSDTTKATVNSTGTVRGVAKGTSTIRAAMGTLSAMTTVTVTDAVLTSLAVTPVNPSVPKGLTQQMTATGTFSDGTTQNLTAMATWTSNAAARATVSAAGLVTAVTEGDATITAAMGTINGSSVVTVTAAVLQSIAITPATPSVAKGLTLSLTATGTYSDNSTQDLSATATWTSSNVAVATVNGRVVTGVTAGTSTITATMGAVSGTTSLEVTAAVLQSIQVTPVNTSLPRGRTRQFTATGLFSDSTSQDLTTAVTWTSSDAAMAAISNADGTRGLATAIALGTVTITATMGTISGTTNLTVTAAVVDSIAVTPATFTVALGTTQQLTATATYSDTSTQDVTTQVTWSSSNASRAAVSNADGSRGLVTALAAGAVTISATLSGVTGTSAGTVTAATLNSIAVAPATASISEGSTQQYTATGTYSDNSTLDLTDQVTWSSSDTAMAQISNAAGSHGLATGISAGNVTITATMGAVSGTASLTVVAVVLQSIAVTPATASIFEGATRQYTATGTYSDNSTQDLTDQVTWSSSDIAMAQISNAAGSRGLATAISAGDVTITATMGAVSGTASLTVVAVVLQSIAVTPASGDLPVGLTLALTATGSYSNGTSQDLTNAVVWSSSNEAGATVSNTDGTRGVVTALAQSTVTITATLGAISGTATVNVLAPTIVSIAVAPATAAIDAGATQQFTATATLSDASTADVTNSATWTSSDTAVATVAAGGLATGVGAGTATITAAQDGISGTASLTVRALMSITISEAVDLAWGTTKQLVATGTYSDASTADVTELATWTTSDAAAISVSDSAGTKGLVTGISTAGATITATIGTISDSSAIGGCKIVINEFQVRGTTASDEFIELASNCTSEQSLVGLRIAYRSATNANPIDGADSSLVVTLAGTMAVGEHVFYVNSAVAGSYTGERGTFTNGMADAGGLGLRVGVSATVVDMVGWGGATNLFFETARVTAPNATQSAARTPNRADTDNNFADFALVTVKTPGAAN